MDLDARPRTMRRVSFKPSRRLRFRTSLAALALVSGACPATAAVRDCSAPSHVAAAKVNAQTLRTRPWAPFRRPEVGWETYAPLIGREIGTACGPATPAFAAALARWQSSQLLSPTGVLSDVSFMRMKALWQARRPFVAASAKGVCPPPPAAAALVSARPGEGYGGKAIQLRPEAMLAYRRMVAAARAELPAIAADKRNLTIFSAYRSPDYDAARCARDGDCNGITRATCSPHRTGLAMDLYVGQAPGFGPDSSADPNRLHQSRSPAYVWLVWNAKRFGFANYAFEPWHWEWVGTPAPKP